MPVMLSVLGKHPQLGENCFIAPNATIVGDVVMGNDCSIWFNAVVRGDVHYIRMGNKVNIQDGAVIIVPTRKTQPISVIMFPSGIMHWCMAVPFTIMY